MRKVLVIALREYNAAVRTKAFLLSLLIMPVLMGGSVLIQHALKDYRDTTDKTFAVVDRTPGGQVVPAVEEAVARYNDTIEDPGTHRRVRPRFVVRRVEPSRNVLRQRLELSDGVRRGELAGFLEIGPDVCEPAAGPARDGGEVRYQSNRPNDQDFPQAVQARLDERVVELRSEAVGLKPKQVRAVARPVPVVSKALTTRDPAGAIVDAPEQDRFAPLVVPSVLMMLMFMVVLMTATPLMQGVVEEKMQRIAEVLLGSVQPFGLMMGKLLGMTAVSLTMAAVYLGGAYWAALHYKYASYVSPGLLAWFLAFQTLAALMYGSLFIAVGAACTDTKEVQNLMWPVMVLAMLPLFVLGNVLREPNSAVVTALSFFPFATPTLMVGRQAIPPGLPWWQPAVGAAGVSLTTLACVWAAGRVFRVGILMQGKGARLGELARWVLRG